MYNLIDKSTGDVITTMSEQIDCWQVRDGIAEWQEVIKTDAEILTATKSTKLAEIKTLLAETDYKCLKFVDGELTADEYATTKTERATLRAAYNIIETATTIDEVNAVNY